MRHYWTVISAALAILVYSTLLQIFVWNSPPSYEDQFWMYPRMGWNALQDSFFLKQNQPVTTPIFSGLIWMPIDWLATLVGASPLDSVFLIALARMWIATVAIFVACLMVARCYSRQPHLVVISAFASLIVSSTFIFEQYLRFSGRYASLVLSCLAVISFASEIRLSQNLLGYSRFLTGAGTVLLIPSLATNAANALATLVTVLLAFFWSLTLSPLRVSRLVTLLGFLAAIVVALALPAILQGGSSAWNDFADLRQQTTVFATTSWLEVLQGRGVWWERNYLTWRDQLDEPFRVWIRQAIVLFVVLVIPIIAKAPVRGELLGLRTPPGSAFRLPAVSGVLCLLVTVFISQRTPSSDLIVASIAGLSWWVTNIRWNLAPTAHLVATEQTSVIVRVQKRTLVLLAPSLVVLLASLVSLREQVILAVTILVLAILREQFALLTVLAGFSLVVTSLGFPLGVGITVVCLGAVVLFLRTAAPRRLGSVTLAAWLAPFTVVSLFANFILLSIRANSASPPPFLTNLPDKPSILLQEMGEISPTCTSINSILTSPTPYIESTLRAVELSIVCPREFQVLKEFTMGWSPTFLEYVPALLREFPRALALRFDSLTDVFVVLLVISLLFYLLFISPPGESRTIDHSVRLRLLSGVFFLFNLVATLAFTWIYEPLILDSLISKSTQLVALLVCFIILMQTRSYGGHYSEEQRSSPTEVEQMKVACGDLKSLRGGLARRTIGFGWFIWLVGALVSFWLVTFLPISNLIQVSWLFGGFREPWAKFGSPLIVSFAVCLTLSLSILLSRLGRHNFPPNNLVLLAAGFAVLALLPVRDQGNLLVDKTYLGTPTKEWIRDIQQLSATPADRSEEIGFCFFPSQDLGADILSYRWFVTFTPNVPHRVEGLDLNPAYRQIGLLSYSCRQQDGQVHWVNVCNSDNQLSALPDAHEQCTVILPPIPRKSVS